MATWAPDERELRDRIGMLRRRYPEFDYVHGMMDRASERLDAGDPWAAKHLVGLVQYDVTLEARARREPPEPPRTWLGLTAWGWAGVVGYVLWLVVGSLLAVASTPPDGGRALLLVVIAVVPLAGYGIYWLDGASTSHIHQPWHTSWRGW